jgi:hypothetical protein
MLEKPTVGKRQVKEAADPCKEQRASITGQQASKTIIATRHSPLVRHQLLDSNQALVAHLAVRVLQPIRV